MSPDVVNCNSSQEFGSGFKILKGSKVTTM